MVSRSFQQTTQPPGFQQPPAPMAPPGAAPPGASFYPQQSQQQMSPHSMPPSGMPNSNNMPAAPANERVDFSIQIPSQLCRFTTTKIPQTASQATNSKIPLGGLLRPLAPNVPVDTVQPGTAGIVRCKRCRTYINAFCAWSEHGRRWRCNICAQLNDTPSAYFCHLDEQGLRRDRDERPELSQGVVEFLAPAEYMVRPPQEPTYFFVLDVSATAVQSGLLVTVAQAIKASLDDLPGQGRTKVGFITFDNSVHYYNLAGDLASPQMLVVSDLKELFVPLPDHLLVNLQESRHVVEAFLDQLPEMFAKRPVEGQSCLGPALKAAFTVLKSIGGKMCVFQTILPNLGDGSLAKRDAPGLVGTPNEGKLLKAEKTWYKDTAVEFSRQQISVDMFLFPYGYLDLASLGELPKYTAGSLYSYPFFHPPKDGTRLHDQLLKTLTQPTAFEAVMRIRCTKGVRITNVYGNFYIRGTDLMALPNCNTESVFGFDLAYDEQNLAQNHVTVQVALLYTSSDGERRIRVMTQALEVTHLTSQVVASLDEDACMTLLSKQALDVALKTNLDNARMRLQQVCADVIRTSKSGDKRTVSGYAVPGGPPGAGPSAAEDEASIPDNLHLLPLYTLALMKNVAFRGGTDVHPDERIQAWYQLNQMWVDAAKHFVYPRLFSIHDMPETAGLPDSGPVDADDDGDKVAGRNRIVLPSRMSLTVDSLSSNGVYLLDNGVDMYLWVGRTADMDVVSSLFGVHSLDGMDANEVCATVVDGRHDARSRVCVDDLSHSVSQLAVITSGDAFANRFGAITSALREDEDDPFYVSPKIHIIQEGDTRMEPRFYWFLIEDRASFQGGTFSYEEFVNFINTAGSSAGGPPGPPGQPRGPPGMPPGPPGSMPPGPPGGMPPGQGMMPPTPGRGMPPPPGQGMPPPPGQGMPPPPGQGMPPPPGQGMPPPPGQGMMPPPPAGQG